jgi:hypothetical protein
MDFIFLAKPTVAKPLKISPEIPETIQWPGWEGHRAGIGTEDEFSS